MNETVKPSAKVEKKEAPKHHHDIAKVIVHPLVLLSVVDHFNRVSSTQKPSRVMGLLLGNVKPDKTLDIANSFAVPFDEWPNDPKTFFVDAEYLEAMFQMFYKVAAKERIVGWYHTGPKLCQNDIDINQIIKRFTPNPVLVVIQALPDGHDLPTKAYIEVQEIHNDGRQPTNTFEHVPSEIGAEEAEEVGVEHLLRDIKDQTAGTLSQRITNQLNGLRGLEERLNNIVAYLHQVIDGQMPPNQTVFNFVQDTMNLFPDVTSNEFVEAYTVQTNDHMMAIYLGNLVRTVISLHSLIDNKLSLQKAEQQKQQQKESAASSA
jgi:26S proteasome regulatory subunit N8